MVFLLTTLGESLLDVGSRSGRRRRAELWASVYCEVAGLDPASTGRDAETRRRGERSE